MHRKQWHANPTQKYKAYLHIIFKSQHSQSNGRTEINTYPRCRWQNPRQDKSQFWSVGLETSPERPLAYYITIDLEQSTQYTDWAIKNCQWWEPSIRLRLTIDLRWQIDLLFTRILFSYLDNHSVSSGKTIFFLFVQYCRPSRGARVLPYMDFKKSHRLFIYLSIY